MPVALPHGSRLLGRPLRSPRPSARRRDGRRMALTSAKAGAGESVADWIESNLEGKRVTGTRSMGGSSWSSATVYEMLRGQKWFVKEARLGGLEMFKAEAAGLRALHDASQHAPGLRIPRVFHVGEAARGQRAFIVMEHVSFGGRAGQEELGRALAQMHLAPPSDSNAQAGKFGFEVDNTIGGTAQPNGWTDDWVAFLAERRIGHMLGLINDAGLSQLGDRLLPNLGRFFEGVEVRPSLLHGDLWSGNMSAVEGGGWTILDPAVYYGHHEAEFGMSWCAGFSQAFWKGYRSLIPEDPGFEDRAQLYRAYHFLNHHHLFSGYRGQAESCLRHLVNKL